MHPCPACGSHLRRSDPRCPHCDAAITAVRPARTAAAALLGLTIACSGEEGDETGGGGTNGSEVDYGGALTSSDADTDTAGPGSTTLLIDSVLWPESTDSADPPPGSDTSGTAPGGSGGSGSTGGGSGRTPR